MRAIFIVTLLLLAGCTIHHDCYHYDTQLETQHCFQRMVKRDPCLTVTEPVAQQICYQTAQQHRDAEMNAQTLMLMQGYHQ